MAVPVAILPREIAAEELMSALTMDPVKTSFEYAIEAEAEIIELTMTPAAMVAAADPGPDAVTSPVSAVM